MSRKRGRMVTKRNNSVRECYCPLVWTLVIGIDIIIVIRISLKRSLNQVPSFIFHVEYPVFITFQK